MVGARGWCSFAGSRCRSWRARAGGARRRTSSAAAPVAAGAAGDDLRPRRRAAGASHEAFTVSDCAAASCGTAKRRRSGLREVLGLSAPRLRPCGRPGARRGSFCRVATMRERRQQLDGHARRLLRARAGALLPARGDWRLELLGARFRGQAGAGWDRAGVRLAAARAAGLRGGAARRARPSRSRGRCCRWSEPVPGHDVVPDDRLRSAGDRGRSAAARCRGDAAPRAATW